MKSFTAAEVDAIKENWIMYNCAGWIGINKTTGQKIKCGTYIALLTMISYK